MSPLWPDEDRGLKEEVAALRAENARLRVQVEAALRPSTPLAWHRCNGWFLSAKPDHPRQPYLEAEIFFRGEWLPPDEEDADEVEDGDGKIEWVLCGFYTTKPEALKTVVRFQIHVSDFLRLYPCAHCGGRGQVEYETGVEDAGIREMATEPCDTCYGEGADLLAEAGDVLQAVYWSWLRSAGPGGGAEPLPPALEAASDQGGKP